MKFPSIKSLRAELFQQRKLLDSKGEIDVRLQVFELGWDLHTGDASYDKDHRGCWGSSTLTKSSNCEELAKDLIEQARDHFAQSQPAEETKPHAGESPMEGYMANRDQAVPSDPWGKPTKTEQPSDELLAVLATPAAELGTKEPAPTAEQDPNHHKQIDLEPEQTLVGAAGEYGRKIKVYDDGYPGKLWLYTESCGNFMFPKGIIRANGFQAAFEIVDDSILDPIPPEDLPEDQGDIELIEGYRYQSNSSGTGIVSADVGNEQLEPLTPALCEQWKITLDVQDDALDEMVKGYILAALWLECDNAGPGEYEPKQPWHPDNIAPETLAKMKEDCQKFLADNRKDLNDAFNGASRTDWELAGHEFWLSRNGHDSGFFDCSSLEDQPEYQQKLQAAANKFPETGLYLGNYGKVYDSSL